MLLANFRKILIEKVLEDFFRHVGGLIFKQSYKYTYITIFNFSCNFDLTTCIDRKILAFIFVWKIGENLSRIN